MYAGFIFWGLTVLTGVWAGLSKHEVSWYAFLGLFTWCALINLSYEYGVIERDATLVTMGVFIGYSYWCAKRFKHWLPWANTLLGVCVVIWVVMYTGTVYHFKEVRNGWFSIDMGLLWLNLLLTSYSRRRLA